MVPPLCLKILPFASSPHKGHLRLSQYGTCYKRLFRLHRICCLDRCFTNLNILTNHLGILLKMQVQIQQVWGLGKTLTSSQVTQWTTLQVVAIYITNGLLLNW